MFPLLGQSPPASSVSCTQSSPAIPRTTSLEGVAELAGDMVLTCQGGVPTPAGQAIPQLTLLAFINVNVTSRLLATSPDLSEALLSIDDPAPSIQLACPYVFISGGRPLITWQSPAKPGSLLTMFGTGFGPVNNQPATGLPATDFTSTTLNTPTVTIGGIPAEVTFSGLAPGLVGVWQVTVKLPEGVTFGPAVPVKLSIGGIDANPVTISLP